MVVKGVNVPDSVMAQFIGEQALLIDHLEHMNAQLLAELATVRRELEILKVALVEQNG